MNAVEAAKAYVKTYFDNSDLVKGVKSAQKTLLGLGSGMSSVGTKAIAASAPILGIGAYAAHSFGQAASTLADLSEMTGIGVESLSEMAYASTRLGSDFEQLQTVLKKQQKFLADVSSGSKTAIATLAQMGLTVQDIEGLSPDETFGIFADAISGVSDQAEKADLAMAVFGGRATDMLPLLNSGSAGMAAMRKEARDLGITMDESTVKSGADLDDAFNKLIGQSGALTNAIGAALAPSLISLIDRITPLVAMSIEWIGQNSELVTQVFALTAGVSAAGGVVAGLGFVVSALGVSLGALLTVGGAVVSVLGFLLSPIGLVTAGVVGLIAYSTDLSGAWETLSTSLGDSLSLAAQLVQNGELSLAVELMWSQIQVLWAQGVQWVVGETKQLVTAVVAVLSSAIDNLGSLIDATRNRLAKVIAASGEFVGLLPEGTSDELNAMQQAGQAGESALHDLAKSLETAGEGFSDLGSNVDELKKKIAAIRGLSIEANVAADLARANQAAEAAAAETGKKPGGPKPIVNTGGSALSGTFSAVADRQLFSAGGNVVESELKSINKNTADTAKATKQKARVGA